ncbi:hypothetical protein TNCV_1989161 [Trichonephila clavipes]|nr:hypothetical protein TNCV_1989161 [Trichonephila clavipes]
MPISVYVTLGPEVHEQMFRSGGQSDAKPPVLSSQASLVFIYRPTEGMKSRVDFAQPGKLDKQYALVVKKDIMTLPELVCTAFDFFGGGEVASFPCLL